MSYADKVRKKIEDEPQLAKRSCLHSLQHTGVAGLWKCSGCGKLFEGLVAVPDEIQTPTLSREATDAFSVAAERAHLVALSSHSGRSRQPWVTGHRAGFEVGWHAALASSRRVLAEPLGAKAAAEVLAPFDPRKAVKS